MEVGGRNLTDFMSKILCECGHNFASSNEFEIVREIKEKLCYVPLDFDEELKKFSAGDIKPEEFELPDGTSIKVGD